MITRKRLKEILFYDKETGVFTWKSLKYCRKNRAKIGDTAGVLTHDRRYFTIMINAKPYLAHRLAWLYTKGYLPETQIDHIDRDGTNNSISNLREVSNSCNIRNTGNFSNNTSGCKGVFFDKCSGRWRSSIGVCMNGGTKQLYLGRYDEFDDAVCARLAGEQCLKWSGCDSSSPAYKYVVEHIQGIK